MANLWAVLLGGILSIAGGFGASIYSQWQRRKALRAAFRAEITTILEMLKARGHVARFEEAIKSYDKAVKSDNPPSKWDWPVIFGAEEPTKYPVFESNVGKIGEVGKDVAEDIGLFYSILTGIGIDLRVLHTGGYGMPDQQIIRNVIAEDVNLWRRAETTAESLLQRL